MILTGLLCLLLGGIIFSSGLPADQQGSNQSTVNQQEDCFHCSGEDYRGNHSTTEKGLTCQNWDSKEPHSHKFTSSNYPQHSLEKNYCRNPNGQSQPWCFTTNVLIRWDNCSIPKCKTDPPTINFEMDCIKDRGKAYRGTISVTWSGKTCQKWSAQTPHYHDNYTPEKMPCGDLKENYCRNPDNDTKPWCYTTDPNTLWEFCNVPTCKEDSAPNCAEQDVLNFLNLTINNDRFTLGRPVRHHKSVVEVHLKMEISAVLDVSEMKQTLNLHIWTRMGWNNHHMKWNESDFCHLSSISVPAQSLWKPDIIITEQIERSKNSPSPYVTIWSYGAVSWLNEEVVVTNCKMRVYKFPFDTQSCNITFKSQSYDDNQLQIADLKETNQTAMILQSQDEWVFENVTSNRGTAKNAKKQTLVFTITMQRCSALYIVNFLMPILFFLSLDLGSFLISVTGGEKLGFKITVLLSVTVMQLLLNDILPGSSDKIPLIAILCIGIFTLMLLSVLETILVMSLINRDASSQEKETEQSLKKKRETKLCCFNSSNYDDSSGKTLFVVDELFRDQQTEESINLKTVLEELKEVLLNHRKEEEKEGYWTKMAKKINKIFTMFYFSAVVLFLLIMCSLWISDD